MSKRQSLIEAISANDLERVRALVDDVPDLSFLTEDRLDLVSFAMEREAEEVATFLIDRDVDLANRRSAYTPMQCALEQPYYSLIDRLLERGVDLNVKGLREPGYAIHVLCEGYLEPDLLRRFLDAGADPALQDDSGRTAVDIMLEHYHENLEHSRAMDEMIAMLKDAASGRDLPRTPWWRFW